MAPPVQLTVEQRLARLEDRFRDLCAYISDNNLERFGRSVSAPDCGARVIQFLREIMAERGAK